MRRKLLIIGLSILVVLVAFIYGVVEKLDKPASSSVDVISRDGDMIKIKDVIKLSSYLNIDGDILAEIMDGDRERVTLEEEYLTMGRFQSVIEVVSINMERKVSDIMNELSFQVDGKANLGVEISEFIEFYEEVIEGIPENKSKFQTLELHILATERSKDNINYMVTTEGKFAYETSYDYDSIFNNKDINISQGNTYEVKEEELIDKTVTALTYMNDLVYISKKNSEARVLKNVWISKLEDKKFSIYAHETMKEYRTESAISQSIENVVADITVQDGIVTKITLKPDKINGKVLVASNEYVEIEKYGKIPLTTDFKIYKIYGELGMELANNLLVGYSSTDFVVADGKVVAALIKEPIKADNIRVILKTDQFKDIYHKQVSFTSDSGMKVANGEDVKEYGIGEEVVINYSDNEPMEERVFVTPLTENGKIQITSINRADGHPSYRGRIELSKEEKGIIIINDVSIEEYLYAVIPSEMPSSYGIESLKVQAICARSYAHKQLFANAYSAFGAHVDDSVSYQVYNNINETENSIQAVKETYGKVLTYGNEVATAYYFSTSSGHTASIDEVWKGGEGSEYLSGKLQTRYDMVDGEAVYVSTAFEKPMDFSTEDVFRNFLKEDTDTSFDSNFPWYRWNITMTYDEISKSVNGNLSLRYSAAPNNILTLVSGSIEKNPVYESKEISTVGTVTNIYVEKREASGIISELVIVGSKNTIKVLSEYNIRALLSPEGLDIVRKDGSKVSSLNLLPSAFFVMDRSKTGIEFTGGGYGHGVGLSQNGVKAMADSGKEYEEILKHYYTGIELGFIYE